MSYIIKKNEPLVNLKLTDTGRKNLSAGNLNFATFSLGDGEMDYSSDNPALINILRPVDKQHDIQYPVPYEGTIFQQPISLLTSVQNEVFTSAKERGFFQFNQVATELNSSLWLIGNLTGSTHMVSDEIVLFDTDRTVVNSYRESINAGDFLFMKFKTSGYTQSYSPMEYTEEINGDPIPYLMYVIKSVDGLDTYDISGLTTGTTTGTTTGFTGGVTFKVDRELPNFSGYVVDAFIYPGKNTIRDYYDNETPIAYWSGGLLDFTSNCTLSNDDVPVWNMNIVTVEDVVGLDSTVYKGKYTAESRNYWGTVINYDYFLNNNQLDKVGIIHYTNNSVSNYYAEGFYKDTLKLKIPYIMWHKKQFGGASLADTIGYTFVCDSVLKAMGANNTIRYYDLVDQETTPTVVGKVFIDDKIILIEDKELLMAMSYKSNRNWTLPTPKLTLTEPGVCPGSSLTGCLLNNEALHITYLFTDSEGISGLHCENYATIRNESGTVKDVIFEFPKNPNDPTYSEFSYLMDFNDTEGYGYRAGSVILIWQKTPVNAKPVPGDWNFFSVNNFIGGSGCLSNITSLCDNFELNNETTIYPTSFTSNKYTLTDKEIGDVIVSQNGLILKQASSVSNLGVDGDYWKYPLNVMSGVNNTSIIEFASGVLSSGDVVQFHYLIGETNTSSTIRQDIQVPIGGIPSGNDYNDGIYLIGSTVCLTLDKQPNNSVVYIFYNGQLISANNYGVIPTGTTANRRVELTFTPADGSLISLFYLDNSGLGTNPISNALTANNIQNLRVNLDKTLLDNSEGTKYDINDFISLDSVTNITGHTFGDETFFFGNIETDIKATIYKSLITCNVLPNKYISTSNPTFNPDQDKVAFTELGVYDADGDLVAIAKFSQPLTRKYNSDVLIIQATIDF
jgi:hypothetical protein